MPLVVPPNLPGRDSFVHDGNLSLGGTGWEGSGATVEFATSPKKYQFGSLKVTVDGSNVGAKQKAANGYPVTPGKSYLADISCIADEANDALEVHMIVAQYRANDSYIGNAVDSGQLVLATDEWKVAPGAFEAHAEAAYVLLFAITWGAQTGIFYLGGARVRPADK